MRNDVPHYTVGGIECIDYLKAKMGEAQFMGFLQGNGIKYLTRMFSKGIPPVTDGWYEAAAKDARKAETYCRWLAETLEGKVLS